MISGGAPSIREAHDYFYTSAPDREAVLRDAIRRALEFITDSSKLGEAPDESYFRGLISDCLLVGDAKSAATVAQHAYQDVSINFGFEVGGVPEIIRIQLSAGRAFIFLDQTTASVSYGFMSVRLSDMLPLIAFWARWTSVSGEMLVNLSDLGSGNALSFSQDSPDAPMTPDCSFVSSRGYADARAAYQNLPSLDHRKPQAIWRGATTGQRQGDWRSLPRIRLCQLVRAIDHPEWFDCAVTSLTQLAHPSEADEIHRSGLTAPEIPNSRFGEYRYQIDIDGNTNSWPGLFIKLLSGSPVFKIASPGGYRQWYYTRLSAWYNYIPVSSDLSDLLDKFKWVQGRPERAEAIGRAGRQLALSMTLEEESWRSLPVVEGLLARS